ncbi:MAG: polyprenyl synthetase family protein [Thaumarchaeota archaeon]|nr:polyprenyl synthetase family protein [Candidatus Calditenuaceae archaeon]MDW8186904.1 polyprenyl synthetase family protein [Nitrososphaerota archaeon]
MEALESLSSRYMKLITYSMESILPRTIDDAYLKRVSGLSGMRFDTEAITKSVSVPAWDLLDRGGKRWRPVLTMLTYEALGGEAEEIADLAVVTELIHNGTLAVDDVEDQSELRRGKPCVHVVYGQDVAINMGNTLYFLPIIAVLRKGSIPRSVVEKVLTIFVEEMTNLSLGQAIDIAWHRSLSSNYDEHAYLTMCSLKTGSLVRMGMRFACSLANTDAATERALTRFGDSIAVAFQIQDDVLNLVGVEHEYGKEIGGDIKEGKRTLMVVHAIRTLPQDKSKRLEQILSSRPSDPFLIREAIDIMKEAGSIDYARTFSRRIVMEAWAELDGKLPDSTPKEALRELSEFLITRSR